MSLVSIIIPYFKKKKYFSITLKSILRQKYDNYEIIIVYDDTEKKDLEYLIRLKKKSKKIKLLLNKKNMGAGFSRNKAIKASKGNYIAFLDADDQWLPNKLKMQIGLMKKNKWKASHTSYLIVNENNKIIGNRIAKNLAYNDLIKSCDIGLSTVILKKELLKNCKFANLKTKEDYVLWLNIAKKNVTFNAINKNLVIWKKTKNSLSSSILRKLIDGFFVYRIYLKKSFLESIFSLFILSINFLKK